MTHTIEVTNRRTLCLQERLVKPISFSGIILDKDETLICDGSKEDGAVRMRESASGSDYVTLLPGVAEFLQSARRAGIRLAILSNDSQTAVDDMVDGLKIREFFDICIGAWELAIRKPNPSIFHDIAYTMGVAPSQCLMIGDSLYADIGGAKRAGMMAALVDRFQERASIPSRPKEYMPDLILDYPNYSFTDLLQL